MEKLEHAIRRIRQELGMLELLENEALSAHCSFKIGEAARVLARPSDEEELAALCRLLQEEGIRPLVLGRGSNLLFPDEGLPHSFLIETGKLQELRLLDENRVYAAAGVSLAALANFAWRHGLTGLEFAAGIPGSLGGGLVMNAGAYGGELKDVVLESRFFCLDRLDFFRLEKEECAFRYRDSVFKGHGGCVITGALLQLQPGDPETIAGRMRQYSESRREKQPLDYPSAGSTFKRPEGHIAAALIDQAGLKGLRVGDAQVSEKHAGFVINRGHATAQEVRCLMEEVGRIVEEKSGVRLEPEIIVLPPPHDGE